MNNKFKLFLGVFVGIFVVGIILLLVIKLQENQRSQDLRSQAALTPSASLEFFPGSAAIVLNQNYSVNVGLTTNTPISSFALRVTIPKTYGALEPMNLRPNAALAQSGKWSFPFTKVEQDTQNYYVDFAGVTNQVTGEPAMTTAVNVLTFDLKAKALTSAPITISYSSDVTKVMDKNDPSFNILTYTGNAQFTVIASQTASPTPTPTCTPRPACLDAQPACLIPEPIEGWCPISPTPTRPAATATPRPATPTPTRPAATATPRPATPTPTRPAATATPTTPVATATPTTPVTPPYSGVTLKLRLQGITEERTYGHPVRMTFLQNGVKVFEGTSYFFADALGVYSNRLMFVHATDLTPGTYDLLLKSPSHLQKRYTGVQIVANESVVDLSNTELLSGDVNNTNSITIEDIAEVLSLYTDFVIPASPETPEDINDDHFITITDVALGLLNYDDFTIQGEE